MGRTATVTVTSKENYLKSTSQCLFLFFFFMTVKNYLKKQQYYTRDL